MKGLRWGYCVAHPHLGVLGNEHKKRAAGPVLLHAPMVGMDMSGGNGGAAAHGGPDEPEACDQHCPAGWLGDAV